MTLRSTVQLIYIAWCSVGYACESRKHSRSRTMSRGRRAKRHCCDSGALYTGVAQSVEQPPEGMSLVRAQPSVPSPKADSVQGLKAGKPLPAGCVQICPVSKARLRVGPFDLPALNRALLRIWGPLSSGHIRKRGISRYSSIGRAPRPEGDAGSNPAVCAKSEADADRLLSAVCVGGENVCGDPTG